MCLLAFDAHSQTARDNQSPGLTFTSQNADAGNSSERRTPEFNKKPLKDFTGQFKRSVSSSMLDVSISSSLSIEADRNKMRRDTSTAMLSRMLATY